MENGLTVQKIKEAEAVLSSVIKMANMLGINKAKGMSCGMEQSLEITGVDLREIFEIRAEQVTNENWIAIVDILKDNSVMSPAEIAMATGINKSTIKSCLARMTNKGLVSSVDGRYGIESSKEATKGESYESDTV